MSDTDKNTETEQVSPISAESTPTPEVVSQNEASDATTDDTTTEAVTSGADSQVEANDTATSFNQVVDQVNSGKIEAKDVTIVIPVLHQIKELQKLYMCIQSIDEHLPNATVVISTFENINLGDATYDELIVSENPGLTLYTDAKRSLTAFTLTSKYNNVNQRIVVCSAAMKKVKTKYTCIMDYRMYFYSDKFLDIFHSYPDYDDRYKAFKGRIMTMDFGTYNSESNRLYTISDTIVFAYSEDLHKMYDIELTDTKKDMIYYPQDSDYAGYRISRYYAEQYIFIKALHRMGHKVHLDDMFDIDDGKRFIYKKYLANNVLPITIKQFQVYINDGYLYTLILLHIMKAHFSKQICNHERWVELYNKHAHGYAVIPNNRERRIKMVEIRRRLNQYTKIANMTSYVIPVLNIRHKVYSQTVVNNVKKDDYLSKILYEL